MKQAKGQLNQRFIDMSKFNTAKLQLDKKIFSELMGHISKTMSGLQKARKSIKLSELVDSSHHPPIIDSFWNDLTAYAKSIGIDLVAFTEVDEYFIFEKEMTEYHVKDKVLDNAIMLGMEMKKDAIDQAPEPPAGNEAMRIYAELGMATVKIAEYLHERGYKAQAFHPFGGPVLYPPMAQKAGLGEIGYNGLLITREFGPRLRLSMVATDAEPLPNVASTNLGIREYCQTCGICVKNCPTGAVLPGDQKRKSPDNKYLQNIEGEKCFPQFFNTHGCSICIKVCPFSKLGYDKVMAKAAIQVKS